MIIQSYKDVLGQVLDIVDHGFMFVYEKLLNLSKDSGTGYKPVYVEIFAPAYQ